MEQQKLNVVEAAIAAELVINLKLQERVQVANGFFCSPKAISAALQSIAKFSALAASFRFTIDGPLITSSGISVVFLPNAWLKQLPETVAEREHERYQNNLRELEHALITFRQSGASPATDAAETEFHRISSIGALSHSDPSTSTPDGDNVGHDTVSTRVQVQGSRTRTKLKASSADTLARNVEAAQRVLAKHREHVQLELQNGNPLDAEPFISLLRSQRRNREKKVVQVSGTVKERSFDGCTTSVYLSTRKFLILDGDLTKNFELGSQVKCTAIAAGRIQTYSPSCAIEDIQLTPKVKAVAKKTLSHTRKRKREDIHL